MSWGNDNSMYVGQTNRGWGSTGPNSYAFQRLVWTGKIPFEMKAVRAMPDGFEIEFTKPVDASSASMIENYDINSFIYKYHPVYGSPAVNIEANPVTGLIVSDDLMRVRLVVDNLRLKHVHEIKVSVVSKDNHALLHNTGYYTLNNIPKGKKAKIKRGKTPVTTPKGKDSKNISTKSGDHALPAKRTTEQPMEWDKVDQVVQMGTVPGLKYDVELVEVKAGARIKLTLVNDDDMPHNMLIVKPGTANKVGEMALQLGMKGMAMDYVPEIDEVLYHTELTSPGQSDTIYIQAPSKPGDYQYLCTYPGHYILMRGILRVVK